MLLLDPLMKKKPLNIFGKSKDRMVMRPYFRLTFLGLILPFFAPLAYATDIIDGHVHLGSYERYKTEGIEAKEAISLLDKANIKQAVVLSAGYRFKDEAKAKVENDFAAAEIKKSTGRLIGFCGVHVLQA